MNRVIKIFLIVLSGLLVLTAVLSLFWRIQGDATIMLYNAFLMDRFGFVPYHDILDMNMPGNYLAYSLIGKLSAYTDLGGRIVDLTILAGMLALNWLWMKKISKTAAWVGTLMWGLYYLAFGPRVSLQREYLMLLPLLAGLLVFANSPGASPLRGLAVGFFFGAAGTIKPQAMIALPLLVIFDLLNEVRSGDKPGVWVVRSIRQTLLPVAAGLCLPFAIAAVYLWAKGSLRDFLDIAIHYWPLYAHETGDHTILNGLPRFGYLAQNLRQLGGFAGFLAAAAVGSYTALFEQGLEKVQKRQFFLLIGLVVCYGIYPVFGGQFWTYHWILFVFFAIQLSSMCFIERSGKAEGIKRLFPILIFLIVFSQTLPLGVYEELLTHGGRMDPPEGGRPDEIAAFLAPRLQPGDTVQPLDWTGGAIHAMLILQAKIATPFTSDTEFYLNVSNPYIHSLRERFITDLGRARPRFIIDVYGEFKPWVSGPGTTREFDELQAVLDEDYTVVFNGDGYRIYELRLP